MPNETLVEVYENTQYVANLSHHDQRLSTADRVVMLPYVTALTVRAGELSMRIGRNIFGFSDSELAQEPWKLDNDSPYSNVVNQTAASASESIMPRLPDPYRLLEGALETVEAHMHTLVPIPEVDEIASSAAQLMMHVERPIVRYDDFGVDVADFFPREQRLLLGLAARPHHWHGTWDMADMLNTVNARGGYTAVNKATKHWRGRQHTLPPHSLIEDRLYRASIGKSTVYCLSHSNSYPPLPDDMAKGRGHVVLAIGARRID